MPTQTYQPCPSAASLWCWVSRTRNATPQMPVATMTGANSFVCKGGGSGRRAVAMMRSVPAAAGAKRSGGGGYCVSKGVRLSDLFSGRRSTARMRWVVLPAGDVGRAIDVMQAHPVATLGMAVDLLPHQAEDGEFAQTASETTPEQVPPAVPVEHADERQDVVQDHSITARGVVARRLSEVLQRASCNHARDTRVGAV
jgi:hypothetical protein